MFHCIITESGMSNKRWDNIDRSTFSVGFIFSNLKDNINGGFDSKCETVTVFDYSK